MQNRCGHKGCEDAAAILDNVKTPLPKSCLARARAVTDYAAGYPCQPYSPEGQRAGLADSRGKEVFDAMIKRLAWLGKHSRPVCTEHCTC